MEPGKAASRRGKSPSTICGTIILQSSPMLQFLRARTIRRLVQNLPALKVHLKPDRYIVRLLREHGYTIPFRSKILLMLGLKRVKEMEIAISGEPSV